MSIWAIVPIKRFAAAKSRLPEALGGLRGQLAQAMARHVLGVLDASGSVARIVVVADNAAMAAGHDFVPDPGGGLNAAVAAGVAHARAGGAGHVAVVHADLPELTSGAFDRLVQRYLALPGDDPVGLVPCEDADGTNILFLRAADEFPFAFGKRSFDRHLAIAGPRGSELLSAPAARDVDRARDLSALSQRLGCADEVPEGQAQCVLDRLAGTGPEEIPTAAAARIRDAGFGDIVTYSRKVFLPLTQLCRDVCHYCTFAQTPKKLTQAFMPADEAVETARKGAAIGCKEALFTLGERPELRYEAAREWLSDRGFASTLHYVAHVAERVLKETGLLPHINAGCMSADEIAMLRPVSASMGLMLESSAARLCEKGGPHYGSPDKRPEARLATIAEAGRQCVPFTTGLLVGIGETRAERVEALEAIAQLHARHGHIQEIIIQNFAPKPGTKMAGAPPAPLEELVWTIAAARRVFGPDMSIQAPPNLSAGSMEKLVHAGINDWGGVSPLTPDYVNPEAPWPEIERLRLATEAAGKQLAERLTIYPQYLRDAGRWLDPALHRPVRELADSGGRGREDAWRAGRSTDLPASFRIAHRDPVAPSRTARIVQDILDHGSEDLPLADIAALFDARGSDYRLVCEAADNLRREANGEIATYVVNRNINYTNICAYRCSFCAFSKGTRKHEGAEKPYLLDLDEITRRVAEAAQRGGTEVCLQGGIHPSFTGETYLDILRAVRRADPAMHVHAFSPLEVHHGASTLGMALDDYLALLKAEGLGSLPGTAAEILHDPVRQQICPDKLTTAEWLDVLEAAHGLGIPTTSTMMFGHVEHYREWAIHLRHLRDLQMRTGGITEFVPLAFVAHEAPMYKRGQARPGPTLREAVLVHAVARLVLHPHVPNVQASWVKLGRAGMVETLSSGANDMGGTLMDESITRAAGATHGQEMTAADMQALAQDLGRHPVRRSTLYRPMAERDACSLAAE